MANIPATMQAIAVEGQGKDAKLFVKDVPTPQPGAGQVVIRNAGAGVNRADTLQASGHYPPPPGAPDTLGLEVSGTIVAVGSGVMRYKEGDEVCALLIGGGYAQYSVASELCLLPIPKGVSLKDASGLPEVYFTVWANVFDACKLQPGENFLVHGGSSGIGTMAIALGQLFGMTIIVTAGSDAKCARALELGAASTKFTPASSRYPS